MRERMDEKKIERGGGKWREGSKGEKKRRRIRISCEEGDIRMKRGRHWLQ